MKIESGYGNMLAELAMHLTRFLLLLFIYKVVLPAVIGPMPAMSWQMGILVYSALALLFNIDIWGKAE